MAVTALSAKQPSGYPQTDTLPVGVRAYEWAAGATGDTGAPLRCDWADDITLTLEGTVTSVTWQVSNEMSPTVWVPITAAITAAEGRHIDGRYMWIRPNYTTGAAIIARAVLTMAGR